MTPSAKPSIALRLLCVLCVLCVMLGGCGYALAGRGSFLPDYIRTIGIPTFLNRTTVFNLETMLTEKVRAEFIGRGKYQTCRRAPASMRCSPARSRASRSRRRASTRSSWPRATRSHDGAHRAEGHEGRTRCSGRTPASSSGRSTTRRVARAVLDPAAFFQQDTTALGAHEHEFARTIVSAILEAF